MVEIIKANGDKEPFSEEKLITSIKRAGIPTPLQQQVLAHVKEKIYENIPSSEIYHHIIEFLEKSPEPYARSRYSLKNAIMALGPTGFPFEDFVARILQAKGYTTQTRVILQGKCISHEIDVIAEKKFSDGIERIMVEAKFHNLPGTKTDSHVVLYTKARFDDVKEKYGFTKAWVITNTKATIDAFSYGDCVGLKVIGWSLPEGESLRDLVEKEKLTPITALTSLYHEQQQKLLENHIVLCKDLYNNSDALYLLGLSAEKRKQVLAEAELVCAATIAD